MAGTTNAERKPRPYTASPWGDLFLTHHPPCTPPELLSMKDRAQANKEEVRRRIVFLLDASDDDDDLRRKLDLVDALQRLGVDYHYSKEIDDLLRAIYDDDDDSDDLYVTSLRFYLLRKHGYPVSSDVFAKFRDENGNISSDDVNCMMALYDAAHLRTHGEEILDSIIAFNKNRLQSLIATRDDLGPELAEEVRFTLETTRFRRVERVEARRFISVYEKKATRDETLLEFAKLDYNILQLLYCQELKELTIWWKDFQTQTDLRFARDRLVEVHFWMMGVLYEPYYSYSRTIVTKFTMIVSVFDDLYDNCSTTEESKIFTEAMERWDRKAAEQLPEYLKAIYCNIIGTIDDIVEELKLQNNKNAEIVRRLVIHVAKSYHAEVKWRDEHYVPNDVEEHLQISVRSSACMQIANMAFISLGDVATREAVEWAFTYPNIIKGVCIVGRIGNDIVSHEREQSSEHVVSTVQTCMKQYGVTVEQANEKLRVVIEKAWMDILQECLDQKYPMALLDKAVNLARTMDFMYKREDAYTLSFSLKDVIDSMYIKFV